MRSARSSARRRRRRLFVTHDQVEALTMCDRIAVMEAGRIVQIGTPREIYDRPATRFVAGFVGRANVLPVTRDGAGALRLDGEALLAPRAAEDVISTRSCGRSGCGWCRNGRRPARA